MTPIRGQILVLAAPPDGPRRIVWGSEVYLVPRASGREVVVGATVEERGFDATATAGGTYELLRDARQVLPMTALSSESRDLPGPVNRASEPQLGHINTCQFFV